MESKSWASLGFVRAIALSSSIRSTLCSSQWTNALVHLVVSNLQAESHGMSDLANLKCQVSVWPVCALIIKSANKEGIKTTRGTGCQFYACKLQVPFSNCSCTCD